MNFPFGKSADTGRMNNAPTTSSASRIDPELIDQLFQKSKEAAIKEAARQEKPVRDIAAIQRKSVHELLTANAKGSDGSAAMGENMAVPEAIQKGVEQRIQEDDAERTAAISET